MADSREQICLWIYRHLFSRAHYWQLRDYAARGVIAPFAIGAMLMVMILAHGHISGPHFNPAVTLAIWMRGKIAAADVPLLDGTGCRGADGGVSGLFMKGHPVVTPMIFSSPLAPFLAEFLGTFALGFVVLDVATAKANSNNSFYGRAIGFTGLASVFAFGSYAGGAFNPAVALGITAMV